jgi:two-component sensor histidine kinase
MSTKFFFNLIINVGIKKNYQPWESHLTRKLNLSALLGIFNVIAVLIIFTSIGYYNSVFECAVVLALAPLVFFLNSKYGYIPAMYLFTFIGCFLFYFLSVKMGVQSFAFLYYFPLILGIIQMVGRKEMYIHLVVLLILCMLSVISMLVSYKLNLVHVNVSPQIIESVKYINIFFAFFTSIGFMCIISVEAIKQEEQLKSALQQKEILLAELFHRVKNNLNIVTSLLNLKKNSTTSIEAQNALEECRNLVFSMALVHTKIYNSNNVDNLNFKEYLEDLVQELVNSIGGKEKVEFEMKAPAVSLNITQAIPCGLIVNELITNSFKHAQRPGIKLNVNIDLKEINESLVLEFKDNGPGKINTETNGSLGMELIRSLAGQLDAEYLFKNNGGLHFALKFKK